MQAFLKECLPGAAEEFSVASTAAWKVLLESAASDAEQAAQLSSLNYLIDAINRSIDAEEVKLIHIDPKWMPDHGQRYYVGGQQTSTTVVGYFDESYIYLTQRLTMDWFLKRMAMTRAAPTFTWSSFEKIAKSGHGAETTRVYTRQNARVLRIPLREVFPNGLPSESPFQPLITLAGEGFRRAEEAENKRPEWPR